MAKASSSILWKQRIIERLMWLCAKRLPYEVRTKREWLIIRDHRTQKLSGEIPRDIAECLGLDCSPIDTDGTCFIRDDISRLLHQQPEWIELLPRDRVRIPI